MVKCNKATRRLRATIVLIFVAIVSCYPTFAQNKDSILVQQVIKEANENSQLQNMAHEASFVAVGAPAFSLSSLNWSYGTYTWHTNRDSYDKIVWDDLKNNVILAATLAYMASEDPRTTPREKATLPINPRTGQRGVWPEQRKATRKGGVD